MRYFLLILALATVLTMAIAGKRGSMTRRPPVELFSDMDRQAKLRPQAQNNFFPDQLSSRLPVPGTVARASAVESEGRPVYPFEENPLNTGRITGSTNFVELNPLPISERVMARGQQRFQIYCSPCHGLQGDGKGITTKYGMAIVANLHDPRIVRQPDGEIFNTITYGKNLMGPYGPAVPVADRWAIIYFLRALQRSHLGTMEDVPAGLRSTLPSAAPAPAAPATSNPTPAAPPAGGKK